MSRMRIAPQKIALLGLFLSLVVILISYVCFYDDSTTASSVETTIPPDMKVAVNPGQDSKDTHQPLAEDASSSAETGPRTNPTVVVTRGQAPSEGTSEPMDGATGSIKSEQGDAIEEAVVGREFPISESLRKASEEDLSTEDLERIARFTGEPRDEAWAATAEALLQKLVESRRADFKLRRVECRKSVCLMEVESRIGAWQEIPPSKDWYQYDLKPRIFVFASEYLDSGAKLTRSLWIYERQSALGR